MRFTERGVWQPRQYPEHAGGQKQDVSNQGVDVWVKGHEVAEGVYV